MTHDTKISWLYYLHFGVGKTTLTKKFNKNINHLKFQYRTQPGHQDQISRWNRLSFFSKKKFEELIKSNKFCEYAKIFENYYGTLKENVDQTILQNDIIFDIDWQEQNSSNYKNLNLVKIYLITNNKEELKKRLIKRNQNTDDEIKKRFNSFDEDIKHWKDYDYIIINKNLDVCFKQIESIILNEKNPNFISQITQ